MPNLKGKVVILTGGSGQIGKGFARALLSYGCRVFIADMKRPEKCAALFRNKNISFMATDVTRQDSVLNTVDLVLKKYRRIDVLVNNAGIGVFTPFEKRTIDEFMSVLKVNLLGTFLYSQAVVTHAMIKQNHGNIINIGSIYGLVSPDPRIYSTSGRNSSEVYAASKAGVIQMSKYLAVHLAKYNIRVNCISPGGVFNRQQKEFVNNYCAKTPLGRMAEPQDLVGALVFLVSDNSKYITGHNLVVDGGFTSW